MAFKTDLLADSGTTRALLQKEMKREVENAAGKTVLFFAAKKFQPPKKGEKLTSLFIVSPEAKKLEGIVKPSGVPVATGACDVMVIDGITRVYIKKSSGSLGLEAVATAVGEAIGDPSIVGTSTDPSLPQEAEPAAKGAPPAQRSPQELAKAKAAADQEQAEHDQRGASAPRKSGAEMAKESAEQAQREGKSDRGFELDNATVLKMTKLTLESAEYQKFANGFAAFAKACGLGASEVQKVPVAIWAALLHGLVKSGYVKGKIKHVSGDPGQFILAEMDGPTGKLIRDELLARAMEGLKPFVAHASTYLDKVIKKTQQGSTWAFWSGVGAKDAARRDANGGIVLEGTIGAWFDEVWDFKALTGNTESLALWATMSELYAKKAAEHFAKFRFVGFLGAGATRDQSVFNKIEQPTFIEVMGKQTAVKPPEIEWYVVDCEKGADDRWAWSQKPSVRIGTDRDAALAEVRTRYAG